MFEQLEQIASGVGGVESGDLISKADKKALYEEGLVWPAYGSIFRLTPAGVARCKKEGIEVAPFASIGEAELRGKREEVCDSDWDRDRFDAWLARATEEK